ncbi:uncharacterized protein F4812DRAFT_461162 [Daldinia caldariorum]|uniref:uncharacterized protein n=1 Tax=Daldinia caldariorum TaxID=326644 RepID=UPI0020088FAA|nr:uncharacterized protein F4812DRAFT_461162 [Daldinia caldariorum]KAI1466191.1 hypothetical protein F4812DRAFT_461162 [Daldinia caldariorum]
MGISMYLILLAISGLILITALRRRENRNAPAPRVYTSRAPPRRFPPGKLPSRAWNQHDIDEVAELLSHIKFAHGSSQGRIQKCTQGEWKYHFCLSLNIKSLIERLNDPSFPRDYFAFLELNNGNLDFFTYENGPLLSFRSAASIRWDENSLQLQTFMECLIGKSALNAALSELEYTTPIMQPVRMLSIEGSNRVCLIGPQECQRVAQLWAPLLAHPNLLSENVKGKALHHFNEHFGGVSPLATKSFLERWIVLEQGLGKTGTRIFPSFACYLAELAKMDERHAYKGDIRDLETQIAVSDRHMWTRIFAGQA